ncbi:hypothetical protein DFH06DRAFT_1133694 [Mycena polygramma]|nr:hypothetical protein DFH06DRAFT_1133694 [Mycena polygramma]
MSIQPTEDQGRPSDSNDWRAPPPHLPLSTGTDGFVSAPSQMASNPPSSHRSRARSESSRERTESPGALSGLTATVQTDSNGRRYFQETSTNLRIEVFDQAGQPILAGAPAAQEQPQKDNDGVNPSATLSEESDLTPETRSDLTAATATPESLIKAILDSLEPNELSNKHIGMLHTVQGALVTSRLRLLNTTAVVVDQRKTSQETRDSLQQFRDETADRFLAFDDALTNDHNSLERCIQANVRLLTELGQSEETMARLLQQVRPTGPRDHLPPIPPLSRPQPSDIPSTLASDINAALPSRRDGETHEEFQRRAAMSADSKKRASEAFVLPTPRVDAPFKSTRFEDPGSISSAPRYRQAAQEEVPVASGFGPSISAYELTSGVGKPTFDAMEEFNLEAENLLRMIIYRQVGLELTNVPARIRTPKLDNPSKYSGANDHQEFVTWLEELVTWMRASFMGGPGADSYRITVLKTNLLGNALKWFIDYVEARNGTSAIKYDFESIICAMHRRFVTAATAQKASREFEAIRYKPEDGPLKLMDNLVDASSRMREPMPEFIIRQKFMRLLPDAMTGLMTLHRGLSAEYTDIATLRFNAWQIWDVYNNTPKSSRNALGTSTSTPAAAPTPATRPFAAARRDSPRSAATTHSAPTVEHRAPPGTHAPAAAAQGSQTVIGPNAHKRCFRCGYLGHIGTDKVCPKNVDNPRVAAQRVEDDFVDEDHVVGADEPDASQALVDDHWGGSQFDPDHDVDENPPADLGDLISFEEDAAPRVGAMHLPGFFSMRIGPESLSLEELEGGVLVSRTQVLLCEARGLDPADPATVLDELYEDAALHDIVRLREYRRLNDLPPYTEAELSQIRDELVEEHEYPVSAYTNYDDAMHHYRIHEGPATAESMDEWAAIMTLGAAEHCEIEGAVAQSMPLGNHMTLSTRTLEMGIDRLASDAAEYVPHLQDLRAAQSAATAVRDTAQLALDEAHIRTNPDATGRAREIRARASEVYQETLNDMTILINEHSHSIRRLEALQSVLVEELRIRRSEQEDAGTDESTGDSEATDSGDEEDEVASTIQPGEDSDADSTSPPPSYRSDSTFNVDVSPPVSEGGHSGDNNGSRLTNLDWHDIMVAAAAASNSTAPTATAVAPVDAMYAPPEYSATSTVVTDRGSMPSDGAVVDDAPEVDSAASNVSAPADHSSAPDLALQSRRIVGDYYPSLRDDDVRFGTEFDDRSLGELQFIFGEGADDLDRDWPAMPGVDEEMGIPESPNSPSADNPESGDSPRTDITGLSLSPSTTADLEPHSTTEYELVEPPHLDPEPRETDELVVKSLVPILGQDTAEWCCTYVDHKGTLSGSTPYTTLHHPWAPTLEEIQDEDAFSLLPSLPWDYPVVMIPEAVLGFNGTIPIPPIDDYDEDEGPVVEPSLPPIHFQVTHAFFDQPKFDRSPNGHRVLAFVQPPGLPIR